jgi:hypothetical protein
MRTIPVWALVWSLGAATLGCQPIVPDAAPPSSSHGDDPSVDLGAADLGAADLGSRPSIVERPIDFGAARKAEMAAYSLEHYGDSSYQLDPKLIVLHFTSGSTFVGAFETFASDTPTRGELPGTCAHYIVDKDGTIYHLVDEAIRCRHAIGVNHVALGIEMVQEDLATAHKTDQQILARPAQISAALHLVKWLQAAYGIADTNVIGHAMANDSPLFLDLTGAVNDHDDWQAADVAEFRARLSQLP